MSSQTTDNVDLVPWLINSGVGIKPWAMINGVEGTPSKFYGYKNALLGPGDDAFNLAFEWADSHCTPLIVIFDNGGANGNEFVKDLNDYLDAEGERYFLGWMRLNYTGPSHYNCMFTYFKGTTTSPKACADAYDFCSSYGASDGFPVVVCYWKAENGTVYTSTAKYSDKNASAFPLNWFKDIVNRFITSTEKKIQQNTTIQYITPMQNTNTYLFDYGNDLRDMLIRSSPGMAPYVIHPTTLEECTAGLFYGYKNAKLGPGDYAFEDAKAWAELHNTPLVVVLDTGTGVRSHEFTLALNDDLTGAGGRYLVQWMNKNAAGPLHYNCMFTYFKGTTTSPKACADAYDFCYDICNFRKVAVSFPLIVGYWKMKNGTIRKIASAFDSQSQAVDGVNWFKSVVSKTITISEPQPNNASVNLETNLLRCLPNAMPAIYNVVTKVTGPAKLYGYLSNSYGPGDYALSSSLGWSEQNYAPFFVLYDDLGPNSDAFTADLNDGSDFNGDRYFLQWMNLLSYNGRHYMMTYFKADPSKTTISDACKDAYDFCVALGASAFPCLVSYWKWANGEVKTSVATYTGGDAATWFETAVEVFVKKNTPPPDILPPEPPAPPEPSIHCDVSFYLKEMALQAIPTTLQVYVPFIRIDDSEELGGEYTVNITYPDGTTTSIRFNIGPNIGDTTVLSVPIAGKWEEESSIEMTLQNTEQVDAEISYIECIAAPKNSIEFPYLPSASASLVPSSWSLGTDIINSSGQKPAFFIVVSGSVVANDMMRKAIALFNDEQYYRWALQNNICNIVIDCPEDIGSWTGASLLSYGIAPNGKSGAYFLSMNGLSPEEAEQYSLDLQSAFMQYRHDWTAPNDPEVLLVRANGTEAGLLSLHYDGNEYDVQENLARLDELVANASDLTESANNTIENATTTSYYGGNLIAAGSMSVNDTIDYFRLISSGLGDSLLFDIVPDGEVPKLARQKLDILRYDKLSDKYVNVKTKLSIRAENGARHSEFIYHMPLEDINAGRIYLEATAYRDGEAQLAKYNGKSLFKYAIDAYNATPNPGVVSFALQPLSYVASGTADIEIDVPLLRLFGTIGLLLTAVQIDYALTDAPSSSYEFSPTNIAWEAGESDIKHVALTLKPIALPNGTYSITLRIDEVDGMPGVPLYYTTYTIRYSIGQ